MQDKDKRECSRRKASGQVLQKPNQKVSSKLYLLFLDFVFWFVSLLLFVIGPGIIRLFYVCPFVCCFFEVRSTLLLLDLFCTKICLKHCKYQKILCKGGVGVVGGLEGGYHHAWPPVPLSMPLRSAPPVVLLHLEPAARQAPVLHQLPEQEAAA